VDVGDVYVPRLALDCSDSVFGGPGNGVIDGGNGDDTLVGNFGDDTVTEGNGDDLIDGDIVNATGDGPAQDPLANHDMCDGGKGANQLFFCEA
jgi:Ca2+-binding RTX toxin-like protein